MEKVFPIVLRTFLVHQYTGARPRGTIELVLFSNTDNSLFVRKDSPLYKVPFYDLQQKKMMSGIRLSRMAGWRDTKHIASMYVKKFAAPT